METTLVLESLIAVLENQKQIARWLGGTKPRSETCADAFELCDSVMANADNQIEKIKNIVSLDKRIRGDRRKEPH